MAEKVANIWNNIFNEVSDNDISDGDGRWEMGRGRMEDGGWIGWGFA